MTIFRFSLLAFAAALIGVGLLSANQKREQDREMSIVMQVAERCSFASRQIHHIKSDAAFSAGKIAIGGNYLDYQTGSKDERLDCVETALRRAHIDYEDLTIRARAEVPVP